MCFAAQSLRRSLMLTPAFLSLHPTWLFYDYSKGMPIGDILIYAQDIS